MKEKGLALLKSIGYLIIGFIIQFTVSIVYTVIIMIWAMISDGLETFMNITDERLIYYTELVYKQMNIILLISSVITIILLWLIYKSGKKSVIEDFGLRNCKVTNLAIAVIFGLAVWLIDTGALSLIESTGLFNGAFETFKELTGMIVVEKSLLMSILVVGIIVPFAEEFLFRGVVQKTLSKSMPITAAIIIQGILFGIYHGNLIQGIYAIFLGIVFGYVVYRCKSLWPSVIIHMVNNIFASVAHYIIPSSLDGIFVYVGFLVFGLVILGGGIMCINKSNLLVVEEEEKILFK